MNLFIFPLLLPFALPSSVSRSFYKDFSHSALSLVCICRTSDTLFCDEDHAHELALQLRSRKLANLPALRYTLSCVETVYIKYLRRIREKVLGKENVGSLVEKITDKNSWGYCTRDKSAEVFRLINIISVVPGVKHYESDLVGQEYTKNSETAMEAYVTTMYDYKGPHVRKQQALKTYIRKNLVIVKEYIEDKLAEFQLRDDVPGRGRVHFATT